MHLLPAAIRLPPCIVGCTDGADVEARISAIPRAQRRTRGALRACIGRGWVRARSAGGVVADGAPVAAAARSGCPFCRARLGAPEHDGEAVRHFTPRRSSGTAGAGTAGEKRNPCARWQPRASRRSSWSTSSTPSAVTTRPSADANAIVAVTIAVSSRDRPSPATNDWSIFSPCTAKRLKYSSDEKPGPEVVDGEVDAEIAQLAERPVAGCRLAQRQRLGDLEDQRGRLEPGRSAGSRGPRRRTRASTAWRAETFTEIVRCARFCPVVPPRPELPARLGHHEPPERHDQPGRLGEGDELPGRHRGPGPGAATAPAPRTRRRPADGNSTIGW